MTTVNSQKSRTTTLDWRDINVGDEVTPLEIPVTATVIVAGAIASRDFMPVHHDPEFAKKQGSPNMFMNILTTNGLCTRFLTDWAGPEAMVTRLAIRLGVPAFPNDPLRFTGSVTAKSEGADGEGFVEVAFKGSNSLGDHVSGTATISTGNADPEIELDSFVAIGELFEYFQQLIAARRAEPRNDMLSVLTTAEVDGDKLTDEDLLNFAFLLLVAGNETTRNLIALGTLALIEHQDECSKLVADPTLIPSAVEEMLRWTSPVTHMARAATREVEIRGQRIREGDMVVMLYGSANRDEEIFGSDAEEFKVTRHPNPHIAFGCGEHSCVGSQLARLEARVFFEVLLGRYPELELVGDVDRMRATMVPGVKRMPVRLGTAS